MKIIYITVACAGLLGLVYLRWSDGKELNALEASSKQVARERDEVRQQLERSELHRSIAESWPLIFKGMQQEAREKIAFADAIIAGAEFRPRPELVTNVTPVRSLQVLNLTVSSNWVQTTRWLGDDHVWRTNRVPLFSAVLLDTNVVVEVKP